jgi:hypothetical protein
MEQEALWDARDTDNVLSLTRLLESGLAQLHQQDTQLCRCGAGAAAVVAAGAAVVPLPRLVLRQLCEQPPLPPPPTHTPCPQPPQPMPPPSPSHPLCSEKVARAVHLLVPQLAAEQDGVRFGTSQALRNIITDCLDDELIAAAARGAGKPPRPGQQLQPVQSVVAAVVGALGARYEEAWHLALPVAGTLLERLGASGRVLAPALIEAIGALCAGCADLGGWRRLRPPCASAPLLSLCSGRLAGVPLPGCILPLRPQPPHPSNLMPRLPCRRRGGAADAGRCQRTALCCRRGCAGCRTAALRA